MGHNQEDIRQFRKVNYLIMVNIIRYSDGHHEAQDRCVDNLFCVKMSTSCKEHANTSFWTASL